MKRFSRLASREMKIKTRKKYIGYIRIYWIYIRIAKKKKIIPSVGKEARNFGMARYW